MSSHFTHLHVHTDYSLLDGAIGLDKLVAFGLQHKLKALAISDHGNIFGAVKFFQQCKKAGIKPVLGMEAYLTEDARIKDASNKYYHLIILVENAQGYKNLCKLIAFAYTDGFYFKPRIDYKMLEAHSEGLIITSACLGGHIPTLLMQGYHEEAHKWTDWYLRVFGPDRFYLEVQPEDQKDQKILNEGIWELSKLKGIQVVATGDCHYVSAEDREAHEVMLAIQTHHKLSDPDRFTFGDCRVHLRSVDEMLNAFVGHEEAVWTTGSITDRCNFEFETGKLFFPQFEIPQEHTEASYFKALCVAGLESLIAQKRIPQEEAQAYWDRLYLECDLITKMGFIGYFLVVSDFIQWARTNGIPVGPGRGSVAGSLVAWALQVTDIDPIKYNLLFERFLNPERVSMPDIDIDFCIEGRDRVIQYVRQRYGHDKVCQIITFGTMMAKGVIKDVARALGFPFEDSNALTDLIPDQLKVTLKEALEEEPQLKKLIESNPQVAKMFDLAFRLEGLTRHASKHAAGIVISPEPICEVLPVYVPPRTNDLVTQYAMTELESLGFLKMDFLGLKNLTLIQRAVALIEKNWNLKIDMACLPLDDTLTFQLLCKGDTSGVFQLESEGIRDVLRRLKPHTFEDIIAVNALYRPGPLGSGMVDDFIERKHGRQPITYIFPELESLLKETYGVIVYQEQVMKIASLIGGYSLGEADILRRAMGKKKAEEMAKQKATFVMRAQNAGFDTQKAEQLFELMAYFAGYGFNKSHSAAYALIAYQTAYLKAHYPAEFMACLISLEASDAEKMAIYLEEAKSHAIRILPPDINASHMEFDVVDGAILFGLQGIKNVGGAALEQILHERAKAGKFKHMLDFCMRVDLRVCNKRVLESLIASGACDALPGHRSQKYDDLSKIIDRATDKKKALATGQMGLFDILQGSTSQEVVEEVYEFTFQEEWPSRVKLEREKEVLGVFLTAHPLDSYMRYFSWFSMNSFNGGLSPESRIFACGLLKSSRVLTTKKGEPMAFVHCEDKTGTAEIVVFPRLYEKVSNWLKEYSVFLIEGIVDTGSSEVCKIKAQSLVPLDLVLRDGYGVEALTLKLPSMLDELFLEGVRALLPPGKIKLHVAFQENNKQLKIITQQTIAFSNSIGIGLEKHGVEIALSVRL